MKRTIVLIPHYNNPKGLERSIQSINENVDVLVVDDGSTKIFEEDKICHLASDRIGLHFIYLKNNQGIEFALNCGLEYILSKGYKYIARLDCGDIHLRNRIKEQESFLNNNNDVYLVGCWANFVDKEGKILFKVCPPVNHSEIRKKMFLNCMFIHPTVMFRAEAVESLGYYPTIFKAAEDYAYFFKFVNNYKTNNIPKVLVEVEYNYSGISVKNRKKQVINRIVISKSYFYLGFYPIYGLIRNFLLLITPLAISNKLKSILSNRKN